jgi:hypothetical protein
MEASKITLADHPTEEFRTDLVRRGKAASSS